MGSEMCIRDRYWELGAPKTCGSGLRTGIESMLLVIMQFYRVDGRSETDEIQHFYCGANNFEMLPTHPILGIESF